MLAPAAAVEASKCGLSIHSPRFQRHRLAQDSHHLRPGAPKLDNLRHQRAPRTLVRVHDDRFNGSVCFDRRHRLLREQGCGVYQGVWGATTVRIRDLKVAIVPVSALQPYAGNPRTHSKRQVRQIAASIRAFGWTNPILIDGDENRHCRPWPAQGGDVLGIARVPTICINDMTEAQKRAYILADNKLAENAGWDRELLALELQGLLEMDLDFDVTVTGFEMGEIDLLIGGSDEEDDDADQLPEVGPGRTAGHAAGDLWQLGRHRLLCADATQPASFEIAYGRRAGGNGVHGPPYNVPIDGHVSGLGSAKHSDFAMASGEMSEAEFIAFLTNVLRLLAAHSRDGSIHFVCMDWRHLFELLTAGRSVYSELKNLCVWTKTNGGMGGFYRSQHELVAVFKKGTAAHINNVELGRHGRNRTNVWAYAGMNSFGAERAEALSMHPTVKPVRLVEDAILDCSKRGGLVSTHSWVQAPR